MWRKSVDELTRIVFPFEIKAVADANAAEPHTFEGHAATWDQDLGNDVIHKGAFVPTIKEWKKSGEAIPLLNSHDHFDIFSTLGQALDMKEDTTGLWMKFEVLDGPEGDAVMRRLRPMQLSKRPLVTKMSIGFEPTKFDFEQPEGSSSFWDRIRHIREAKLHEVSLVLFPMNPQASIDVTSVKSFAAQLERTDPRSVSPQVKQELRRISSRIGNVLKKYQPESQPESIATEEGEVPLPTEQPTESTPTPPTPSPDPVATGATPPVAAVPADAAPPVDVKPDAPTEKMYEFDEALQHRIKSVLMRTRVSSIGAP